MKKILLSVAVLAMTMTASAQYFVGGSVGVNTSGGNVKTDGVKVDGNTSFDFNINPKVGYFLSDKVAVGIGAGFGMEKDTNKTNPDSHVVTTGTDWNVAPFMRYYAMEFGKFSVFAEAALSVGGYNSKTKTGDAAEVKETPIMNYSLTVTPSIAYNLSKCISLEANLNFMSLGYYGSYENDKDAKVKTTTSEFDFGFDTKDVASLGGYQGLTVGAIFKF